MKEISILADFLANLYTFQQTALLKPVAYSFNKVDMLRQKEASSRHLR